MWLGRSQNVTLRQLLWDRKFPCPVIISPTGVQAVDPDGEVAVARAAAARGTAMGLSSFASKPIEEVIAANPKIFFQVYWLGGRDAIAESGGARPGRRRGRPDRHHRLVVLARAGLGEPEDPRADGPADHLRMFAGGDHPSRLAVEVGQDTAPAEPTGAQPGPTRRARPAVLRRLRRVDGDAAADLGGHRLVA